MREKLKGKWGTGKIRSGFGTSITLLLFCHHQSEENVFDETVKLRRKDKDIISL